MNTKAMYKLGYGLYVLTVRDGETDNGCIVNTVIQVTSSPNRIAVTVNKQNKTHDMIMATAKVAVSVLTQQAPFSVYQHFGYQSGKQVNKFADMPGAVRTGNGLYYLPEYANAYMTGTIYHSIDLGTHTMFLVNVEECEVLNDLPSVTYDYYQNNVKQTVAPAQTTEQKKGYRCVICGYVYEGDTLPEDYTCPICKHGVADFEPL